VLDGTPGCPPIQGGRFFPVTGKDDMSTAVSIVRDEANRNSAGQGRPEADGPEPEGILPERDEDEAPLTGLRCLAFVAQARNIDLSFERLRHDHAPDGTEHDMRSLIRVARESGMKARGMRLGWEDLVSLGPALPAVVRLKNGSFLVLLGAFDAPTARVILVDPVAPDAPFELDEPRFSESWDGDTLLLRPELIEA
jgi:ABC-type bacteriocin/lantibiotic exporter with double-glycine peptidase domain